LVLKRLSTLPSGKLSWISSQAKSVQRLRDQLVQYWQLLKSDEFHIRKS